MSQQDSPQPTGTQQHEAKRVEAWAAVHRPETTSEELARIAEAHPEFAPAIAEHPNAPASGIVDAPPPPDQPLDSPTSYTTPQYAQPQYAQPQHSQPQSQHAQPQYAQTHYSAESLTAPTKPGLNVAGVIAFSLLVLTTVLGFFFPYVMRQAMMTFDVAMMTTFPLIRLLLVIAAIVLGAIGAKMRMRPRLRWMAVGSLVTGSFFAIPLLLTTLSYASPSLFSFYYF